MKLVWGHGTGLIDNGTTSWEISTSPMLSFTFDGLFYVTNTYRIKRIGVGSIDLTDAEAAEIITYITNAVPA
jgi:hypothetical protein